MWHMQPFVVNGHDRIVFPSNFVPELDLSVMNSLEQLDAVIRRDFEVKAPSGTDILHMVEEGAYSSRYDLMRDLALNLFWTNRFSMTLWEKRPTRWADVPRTRTDVFMPLVTPWVDGDRKVAAVQGAYEALPAAWNVEVEDRIFGTLFDVFGHRKHDATDLQPIKPTVAQILSDPTNLTFRLPSYDPDFPMYELADIVDTSEAVPELEALSRWAKVLHNQYPWDRSQAELVEVGQLRDDDYVVVMHPRDQEVRHFLQRLQSGVVPVAGSKAPEAVQPVRPYPAVNVRSQFSVMPKIEALAVVHGELVCSNEALIRNSAYNWSPMSADEILANTGIESRRYTARSLEEIALQAAKAAVAHSGRGPEEIGAVLVCTCTSTRIIPSIATWISGQLGIYQTHASCDIIAACAGMAYGLSDATRILQEVQRPVLVICVEKFSHKIVNVRPSRMLFGELTVLPDPDGVKASLLESIDLIVPHQANKTMVTDLALKAGLTEDSLYFNVETVGNASSAVSYTHL